MIILTRFGCSNVTPERIDLIKSKKSTEPIYKILMIHILLNLDADSFDYYYKRYRCTCSYESQHIFGYMFRLGKYEQIKKYYKDIRYISAADQFSLTIDCPNSGQINEFDIYSGMACATPWYLMGYHRETPENYYNILKFIYDNNIEKITEFLSKGISWYDHQTFWKFPGLLVTCGRVEDLEFLEQCLTCLSLTELSTLSNSKNDKRIKYTDQLREFVTLQVFREKHKEAFHSTLMSITYAPFSDYYNKVETKYETKFMK